MRKNNKKELLWEWVMYHDICRMHGSKLPPINPPLSYDMWRAVEAAMKPGDGLSS